ncbi:hypothetical protein M513_09669 [Trichuris suis]|uniref:Chondroitin proteoglycan 4 domain-containing protein n=1 Tax=Trichuris suis TaxID=68888 RepID=A0A085LWY8_9BILA|nr:hypothetical protein M513_09669 [Trichuris suis]
MAAAMVFKLLMLNFVSTTTFVPSVVEVNLPAKYPAQMKRLIPGLNISDCSNYYIKCLHSLSFINPRRIQRTNVERFCVQQLHIDVCMSPHLALNAMSMKCGALAKSLVDSDAVADDDDGTKLLALAYQVYYYFCYRNHMYYQLNSLTSPCFEEKYTNCILKFNEKLCLRQCDIHHIGAVKNTSASSSGSPHSVRIACTDYLILPLAMKVFASWAALFQF